MLIRLQMTSNMNIGNKNRVAWHYRTLKHCPRIHGILAGVYTLATWNFGFCCHASTKCSDIAEVLKDHRNHQHHSPPGTKTATTAATTPTFAADAAATLLLLLNQTQAWRSVNIAHHLTTASLPIAILSKCLWSLLLDVCVHDFQPKVWSPPPVLGGAVRGCASLSRNLGKTTKGPHWCFTCCTFLA